MDTVELATVVADAAEVAYEASMGSLLFAAGLLGAAVYESFAIGTNRLPTITELVKRGGWVARVGFVVVLSAALVDHFLVGWLL